MQQPRPSTAKEKERKKNPQTKEEQRGTKTNTRTSMSTETLFIIPQSGNTNVQYNAITVTYLLCILNLKW